MNTNVKTLTRIALLAALTAILSQAAIPMPTGVSITLQTFAVALAGYLLGKKDGTISIVVYLALGAVGIPVFTGFTGGISKFVGVTGGFLWGFLFMAFLCGLGKEQSNRIVAILLGVAGLLICHLCGTLQFSILMGTPFLRALLLVSLPYLVKDILSVVAGYVVAEAVAKALARVRA
jgi:biotin transport system substrate-specific component